MKKLRKALFHALLLAVLYANAVCAAPFNEIVVFGDSLSDNGNLVLFPEQPQPDPSVYYMGRFSNGPVWVEYLADPQRLNADLTDRAFGGAQTDTIVPPGLEVQVEAYFLEADPPLSPDALFVIWIGGNDFLNDKADHLSVVNNISKAMENLARAGARHLLVLNLPDLGAIPAKLNDQPADREAATNFTLGYNAELAAALDRFSGAHPDVALYEFDVFTFFQAVRDNPAAYGFTNVTDPAPGFSVPDSFDGGGHVFWDERHPTTEMHLLIADQVFASLNQQIQPPEVGDVDDSDSSSCFIGSVAWGT